MLISRCDFYFDYDCPCPFFLSSTASMIALTTVTTSPVLVSLPTLSLTVSAAPASPQLKEFTRTEDTQAPV